LGCIALAALGLRLLPFDSCFAGNRHYFLDSDSYFYLREVLLTAGNALHIPTTDYYVGYPQGTPGLMAPLISLVFGALSWLVAGGAHPNANLTEAICALAPPIWGALGVVPVYFLGRQLAGKWAGLTAAACFAVMPEPLIRTLVGNFDNNGLEPLLASVFFLLLAKALPEAWEPGQGNTSRHSPRETRYAVLAGTAGWVALFAWRGSIMFFLTAAVYCVAEVAAACFKGRDPGPVLTTTGRVLLIIGALTTPFVAFSLWGTRPVLGFNVISWFQVLVCLWCGTLYLLLARIPAPWYQAPRARWVGTLIVATPPAVLLPSLLLAKGGTGHISLFSYLLARHNPWGASELSGLFQQTSDHWSLKDPAAMLTWSFFAFPLVWAAIARREARQGLPRPRTTLFLTWSLVFVLVSVLRCRFAPLAGLGVALATGVMTGYLRDAVATLGRKLAAPATVAAAGLMILLLFPAWQTIGSLPHRSYKYPVTDDLFGALDWLRANSPATGHYEQPWQRPEYGVLARWDFGHWITYLGHRPAVATPFLAETYGLEPMARFFLTESPTEAEEILTHDRIRYVIVTNVLSALPNFASMLGMPPTAFVEERADRSGRVMDMVKPAWFRLVSTRLLLKDGLPVFDRESNVPALPHLRLVYESAGRLEITFLPGDVARVKIFEHVPGARLCGTTVPGTRATARIRVVTNQGRTFTWQTGTISGPDGSYTLPVPYATADAGTVHAVSPYLVTTTNGESTVQVDSLSVEEGKVVRVP
jgi:dolichyl-diphosphooligosaccharide--protein glycosyltransferase